MGWLSGLITALDVLPTIVDTVMRVVDRFEDDDEGSNNGPVKKRAVLDAIDNGITAAETIGGEKMPTEDKAAIMKLAGQTADSIVSMRNMTGKYKRSNDDRETLA